MQVYHDMLQNTTVLYRLQPAVQLLHIEIYIYESLYHYRLEIKAKCCIDVSYNLFGVPGGDPSTRLDYQ